MLGKLFWRLLLSWDLSEVLLIIRLNLLGFGRKMTEVKCYSHHVHQDTHYQHDLLPWVLTWWCFLLLGKQGTYWRMGQNSKLQAFVGEVEGEGAWVSDSMTEGKNQRNLTKQGPMGGLHACMLSRYSRVQLFVTLWTVAHQAPMSMGFSRQEYWSGLPCPINELLISILPSLISLWQVIVYLKIQTVREIENQILQWIWTLFLIVQRENSWSLLKLLPLSDLPQ